MLIEQRESCNDRDQHIAKFEQMVELMAIELEMENKLILSPHRIS